MGRGARRASAGRPPRQVKTRPSDSRAEPLTGRIPSKAHGPWPDEWGGVKSRTTKTAPVFLAQVWMASFQAGLASARPGVRIDLRLTHGSRTPAALGPSLRALREAEREREEARAGQEAAPTKSRRGKGPGAQEGRRLRHGRERRASSTLHLSPLSTSRPISRVESLRRVGEWRGRGGIHPASWRAPRFLIDGQGCRRRAISEAGLGFVDLAPHAGLLPRLDAAVRGLKDA